MIFKYLASPDIDPDQNVKAMRKAFIWIKLGLVVPPTGGARRKGNVLPFQRAG